MIRRATPADADAVAELFERSFATLDFLPTLHTLDEHRRHFMNVIAQQEVWVWEDDGRPLGFAAVSDKDELSFLYVEPDELGRGVGSALFEHVKARRRNGFSFWVFQQNDRARRFYEKHGARVVELTDGAGNEEQTPDARYVWSPPDGA
jgi:GNAT superfamily N-acetyltransferase